MYFPQRATAIQQRTVQARHQCKQFSIAPGFWQGRMTNVVIEVEMRILFPVQRTKRPGPSGGHKLTKGGAEILCGKGV